MKKRCTKQTLITSFLATRKHNTVLHNTTTNSTESLTSKFKFKSTRPFTWSMIPSLPILSSDEDEEKVICD